MADKIVRIGGASGYWGDSVCAPFQLLQSGRIDYLIFDYLAEITMSILGKAQAIDPQLGYATDFISRVMKPLIGQIMDKRIKVIANAGGINLQACYRALKQLAEEVGVPLKIGTVEGDNLLPRIDELRGQEIREMATGEPLPGRLMSMNAYLGAFPIAAALDAGADIVVTGRCVDSALAAGPLIHEFGWKPDDYERLAAASLVGHLIECGAQASGGNFTDWEESEQGWENTGYPIAEVNADGSFVLTKPAGTGGLVSPLSVGEQMVYEIGNPAAYLLPDVSCDFTQVTMRQVGPDRVLVSGAHGREPTASYKVSATYADGFGCIGTFAVAGRQAVRKAQRQGEAILGKTRRLLEQLRWGDYRKTALQVIGSESVYGPNARPEALQNREVVLRLGVHHARREGVELFSKEFLGTALSMSPGLTMLTPGRPRPTSLVRLFSFLLDKDQVAVEVHLDGQSVPIAHTVSKGHEGPVDGVTDNLDTPVPPPPSRIDSVQVPLWRLAVARSGDKGDQANIGVVARRPEYLPVLRAGLTAATVKQYFAYVTTGRVERFDLPGIHAMNFLLYATLDGGGVISLRLDSQGKTYAQMLLDLTIPVPVHDAQTWGVTGA